MRIAVTMAAERSLHGPTAARRSADRTRGGRNVSSSEVARRSDLDQPLALHRSDQRHPTPGKTPLGVGHARIEIPGRPSERGRKCDAPAGTPLRNLIARELSADADQRATRCQRDRTPSISRRSTRQSRVTPDGPITASVRSRA